MKQIGTLGTIDTLTIGPRVFTNLTDLIQLYGYVSSNSVNINTSFRKQGASSGYAPSGVNFRLMAIKMINYGTNSQNASTFFYSDNDLGIESATVPTNPVYLARTSISSGIDASSSSAGAETILTLDFLVPSGKFLGLTNNAQTNELAIQMFGYEEA